MSRCPAASYRQVGEESAGDGSYYKVNYREVKSKFSRAIAPRQSTRLKVIAFLCIGILEHLSVRLDCS